ncbi:MAG: hypothetical protein Aureis2KO_25690 [Aureisphaera sp.]
MIPPVQHITKTIPDLIDSGKSFGKKVCIVAPGPNGADHYHRIPEDFSIVAVNKAVLIENLKPDWWVLAHNDTYWFPEADEYFTGNRVYRDVLVPEITKTAFTRSPERIYQFETAEDSLQPDKVLPLKGFIRKGASVSSLSVQLAYNLGATEILLCGVDMSGNKYWDNSENKDPSVLHLHGTTWHSVSRFNPLLDHMRNELGVTISTLSKTQLNVPLYERS